MVVRGILLDICVNVVLHTLEIVVDGRLCGRIAGEVSYRIDRQRVGRVEKVFLVERRYEYFCGDKVLAYETARSWIEDEEYTFHKGRHTFVSLADEYELNETAVKRIVGHSTTNITDRIYTHKTVKQLLKEIDKLPYPNELD